MKFFTSSCKTIKANISLRQWLRISIWRQRRLEQSLPATAKSPSLFLWWILAVPVPAERRLRPSCAELPPLLSEPSVFWKDIHITFRIGQISFCRSTRGDLFALSFYLVCSPGFEHAEVLLIVPGHQGTVLLSLLTRHLRRLGAGLLVALLSPNLLLKLETDKHREN